jgi:resuscitation-promoting factor RpfA
MKCPKCGYLGFETSDRCRNCGYDFSLTVRSDASSELPLRPPEAYESPLADLELGEREVAHSKGENTLDLDRVIGGSASSAEGSGFARRSRTRVAVATPPALDEEIESPPAAPAEPIAPGASASARATSGKLRRDLEEAASGREVGPAAPAGELPLFGSAPSEIDDTPLITPRPVRPPLSVRRATPDVVRGRTRSSRAPRRAEPPDLGLQLESQATEPVQVPAADSRPEAPAPARAAGALARLIAMLIDLVVLASIDAAVLYLTLGIAGLAVDHVTRVPPIPFVAFLLILNGGYLIGFTAASGQTIGKMATGIRVIGDDGQRVDVAGAVLRAAGCLLTLLTAGLGYLPAFFSIEGRAVQDRVAGTRVVSTR